MVCIRPFLMFLVMAMPVLSAVEAGAQTTQTQPVQTVTVTVQTQPSDRPWSFEVDFGLDNSISGNINSGAIGTLEDRPVVILANSYEDVYGTGIHFRFGGGYMLNDESEIRATFSLQSLDAELTPLGEIGSSNLYAQYDDYQSFGLDVGFRRYIPQTRLSGIRVYVEGTIGVAFISEIDVRLVAPAAGLDVDVTDFYDATSAFTLGVNAGTLFRMNEYLDLNLQIGTRFLTGMSDVDNLRGTELDTINDSSSRWTVPFIVGARFNF